jgi:hypothetical protein
MQHVYVGTKMYTYPMFEMRAYTMPDACHASLTKVPAIDEPSPLASVSASMIAAMSFLTAATSTAAAGVTARACAGLA